MPEINTKNTDLNQNVIDTLDYRGIRVTFSKKRWQIKSKKHIWLLDKKCLTYIEKALKDPTEVWQDFDDPKNKRCYYYRYGANLYIKVVVWIKGPNHIVTAYDCRGVYIVKENRYPKLKRIYEK